MIHFEYNGKKIELKEGTNLGLSFKNIYFSFDNIELSRTAQFDIPATPNNNAVFGFPHILATDGKGMRSKYENVTLVNGSIRIVGTLVISQYANGVYKCSFLFGDKLGLIGIKNAGKLNEALGTNDEEGNNVSIYSRKSDISTKTDTFGFVRYDSANITKSQQLADGMNMMPFVTFKYLNKLINQDAFIGTDTPLIQVGYNLTEEQKSALNNLGILIDTKMKGVYKRFKYVSPTQGAIPVELFRQEQMITKVIQFTQYSAVWGSAYVDCYESLYDVDMELCEDMGGASCIVMPYDSSIDGAYIVGYTKEELDQAYDPYVRSGSKFHLRKGDYFTIVNTGGGTYYRTNVITPQGADYWDWFTEEAFIDVMKSKVDTKVNVTDGDAQLGGSLFLTPNLPSISIVDLLKTEAYLIGATLGFRKTLDRDTLYIENPYFLNGLSWDINDILISENYVKRNVLDYAQTNYVKASNNTFSVSISQNNYNVDAEKTLYESPLTAHDGSLMNDFEVSEEDGVKTYKRTNIKGGVMCLQGGAILAKPTQLQGTFLPMVLQLATTIEVSVRCSFFDFNRKVKDNACVLYKSLKWAIADAKWQNDKCTMTLVEIPYDYAS